MRDLQPRNGVQCTQERLQDAVREGQGRHMESVIVIVAFGACRDLKASRCLFDRGLAPRFDVAKGILRGDWPWP
jgi:hypothetical protein